ncbi:AAA family ATPase [Pectobacterium aroidearum]|uniref:AAA family ATPase n=1 Tax=Pectobacterium aroidearum TaxID=1201031 RepID=UPI0033148C4D
MYILKHVNIIHLWGGKNIDINFKDDVNILIGNNGAGKTTVINILYGVLTANANIISKYDFHSILIELIDEGYSLDSKYIYATRFRRDYVGYEKEVYYEIEDERYHLVPDESNRLIYSRTEEKEDIKTRKINFVSEEQLRKILNEIVNITHISTNRNKFGHEQKNEDDAFSLGWYKTSQDKVKDIDDVLQDQLEGLKSYQIEKNNRIKEIALKYQKDILIETLIDVSLSYGRNELVKQLEGFTIKDKTKDLIQAYTNLGVIDPSNESKYRRKITSNLKNVFDVLNELKEKSFKNITIRDVAVLSLYKKLNQVVELSEYFKEETERELAALKDFKNIVNDFFLNKYIEIDFSGDLKLYILENGNEISIYELSSGEKQVLNILIESLLQRGRSNIFMADEPEISLHISWQSKIIKSIKSLNENAQVIIATHSPEVAGSYPSKIIDMGRVVK